MLNPFPYSLDNKRYHTYNYYLKTRYQSKVAKVIINGDFTCPNRDGKKGFGGCTFCSGKGSGDANQVLYEDVLIQYTKNKQVMNHKWQNRYYIPYFQAFSNTYGPLNKIKSLIDPFLKFEEVVEIAIATRCDCLEDEVVDYLAKVNEIKPLTIELGLQSSNDQTAKLINRGHSFEEFKNGLAKLNHRKIKTCIHIMNGLPYESIDDMYRTILDIRDLDFFALKIHMLHILNNTRMAKEYLDNGFNLISRKEYIELVVRQLEAISPKVVIERLTGDPIKDDLIAPSWVLNKTTILNDIDKLMLKNDTWQGKNFLY